MTETITLSEVFKSKQNFSNFIEEESQAVISNVLQGYPQRDIHIIQPQLTQSHEGLMDAVLKLQENKKAYIFWFIATEKEEMKNISKTLNNYFDKSYCGIFIIKTFLNGNKIDFECLLKPELVVKQKRKVNKNTYAKQLQKKYWESYIPNCDTSEYPDMQIKTALPQHLQNVSTNITGVQILQTINTLKNYVASEISIIDNKEIFQKLYEHKEEIEKEVGKLEWHSKENVKSAKIRKTFEIDINNNENHEKAILEHVKMGTELMMIAKKYL